MNPFATSPGTPNPMDAMGSFWKDAWAKMAASAAGASGAAAPTPGAVSSMGAGADPFAWMPSPEMMRRMQSAFLDSMAAASEQYMRSPQFLESMKSSLDSAVQMRRQMEEALRRNMGDALKSPGEAGADIHAALHELEARLGSRIDELVGRLEAVLVLMTNDGIAESEAETPSSGGEARPRRSTKGRS